MRDLSKMIDLKNHFEVAKLADILQHRKHTILSMQLVYLLSGDFLKLGRCKKIFYDLEEEVFYLIKLLKKFDETPDINLTKTFSHMSFDEIVDVSLRWSKRHDHLIIEFEIQEMTNNTRKMNKVGKLLMRSDRRLRRMLVLLQQMAKR